MNGLTLILIVVTLTAGFMWFESARENRGLKRENRQARDQIAELTTDNNKLVDEQARATSRLLGYRLTIAAQAEAIAQLAGDAQHYLDDLDTATATIRELTVNAAKQRHPVTRSKTPHLVGING